jgi:hypothetical protein
LYAAQVWRDIIFGPFTEEFVFRSCMLPLWLLEVMVSFSDAVSLHVP